MRYRERERIRRAKASVRAVDLADMLSRWEHHCTVARCMFVPCKDGHRPTWPLDYSVPETTITFANGVSGEFKLLKGATLGGHRWKSRLLVKCPDCSKWLPFGRLHQHIGASTCEKK